MRINHALMEKLAPKEIPTKVFNSPFEGAPIVKAKVTENFINFSKFYANHRNHQKEACESLVNQTIGQVSIPTGTGKTRIQVSEHISDMISKTKSNQKGVYVIGAHRLLLCRQLLNNLLEESHKSGLAFDILFVGSARVDESSIYNEYKGRHKGNCEVTYTLSSEDVLTAYNNAQSENRHLIVVCTYHSFKRLSTIPQIDVCTYDEAHTLTSPTFNENVAVVKPNIRKNFFFTATRKVRENGEGGMNDESIFGKVLYQTKPRKMIDEGEIVAPRLHIIKATESGNFENESMHIRVVQQGFDEHRKMIKSQSANPSSLGAKVLMSTSGRKELFNIYHNDEFQQWCKDSNIRTLAFSSSQESDEGYYVDFQQVNRQQAFESMEALTDGEDALIFHIEILTEGIDLPSITGVMPFRSLEQGKLFQTLGRASRLLKEDRRALYGAEFKPSEMSKFIKPYAYLILPEDFRHLVNYDEMKSILRNVMNFYEIPIDQLIVQDEYLSDSSEPPQRITLTDHTDSTDQVCNLRHITEDIICEDYTSQYDGLSQSQREEKIIADVTSL